MADSWGIAKDTIGFLGAVVAAVPWFRDFRARLRQKKIGDFLVGGGLEKLKAELNEMVQSWIANPKFGDLLCTMGGLLLVAVSFLIGLIQSLAKA